MTHIHPQAFEDSLRVLTQKTQHCLLTLAVLVRKFPGFSEKNPLSENGKRERQRIYAALQVAIAQLAQAIPSEITEGHVVPWASLKKERITDYSSFDPP